MKTKLFGDTGLEVSVIGLGMAALGRPGYINLGHAQDLQKSYEVAKMQAHSHQVLDAAQKAGVTYFDTARSYGKGELFLANWLKEGNFSKKQFTIGSKWGYTYTANWQVEAEKHEVKEHSLSVLERQMAETKENLGNYLDLYQIHSATLESGVLENTPVLHALAHLKAEGLKIGLSLSGTQQAETLRKAIPIQIDGIRLFDAVQATWNLLEPSVGTALKEAHQAGMGVIVKEALANGRLTSRNQNTDFQSSRILLEKEAQRLGSTLDALAIAAVLAQPFVHVVLSGAAQIEHLESNLQALSVNWDEAAASHLKAIQETPEFYWQKRKSLDWN